MSLNPANLLQATAPPRRRRRFRLGVILLICLGLLAGLILVPPPHIEESPEWQVRLQQQAQRYYWHELLSLYQPPEEIFTPAGLALLRRIQQRHSEAFLPYLVSGSALLAENVFYNPWFDFFVLIHDEGGLIGSIVLASALPPDQAPQLEVRTNFWRTIYRRYQLARQAGFSDPRPVEDLSLPARELLNLANQLAWPSRLHFTPADTAFDLYLQRLNQSIYCTPTEPGTYVVLSVVDGNLRTNVLVLPPYAVRLLERQLPMQRTELNQPTSIPQRHYDE